jgi:hypothetical protein
MWDDAALAQLDEIWKASLDKEGLQNTATRINTELTFNPLEAGKSHQPQSGAVIQPGGFSPRTANRKPKIAPLAPPSGLKGRNPSA